MKDEARRVGARWHFKTDHTFHLEVINGTVLTKQDKTRQSQCI
jgi:hypothetical protein